MTQARFLDRGGPSRTLAAPPVHVDPSLFPDGRQTGTWDLNRTEEIAYAYADHETAQELVARDRDAGRGTGRHDGL